MVNKHLVVVGGSSGIGSRIIEHLLKEGATVTNFSRTAGALEGKAGVTHIQHDITSEEFPKENLPDIIDGLIYCPGTINLRPFRSLKLTDFKNDLEVNVLGAVKTLQAAQRGLKKAEQPSILLFSTVAVSQGMPFHASVATAKAAIEGLTRSLAAEWAPKIRVNCIAPSLTDTPLAEKLLSNEDRRKSSAERHPLKRVGTSEDIAQMALFLLSDKSSWISGQIIGVDGGMSTIRG